MMHFYEATAGHELPELAIITKYERYTALLRSFGRDICRKANKGLVGHLGGGAREPFFARGPYVKNHWYRAWRVFFLVLYTAWHTVPNAWIAKLLCIQFMIWILVPSSI